MIAHKDPNVVKAEIAHIERHFGEMTKTHGAKHSFLGMNIDSIGDMRSHTEEAISFWSWSSQCYVMQTTFTHDKFDGSRSGGDEGLHVEGNLVTDVTGGTKLSHKRKYHVSGQPVSNLPRTKWPPIMWASIKAYKY